jgi:hypothetical protein
MHLFVCEACGRRTVTLASDSVQCSGCGGETKRWSPVELPISFGGAPVEEVKDDRFIREDLSRAELSEVFF